MPARKAFNILGLGLFTLAASAIALQLLAASLGRALGLEEESWYIWVVSFVPLYLAAFPLGLLVLHQAPVEPAPTGKLGAKNFFLFLLMCFPLMYFGNLIGTFLSMLLSGGSAQNGLETLVSSSSPLRILIMVILAPLLEEYMFRKQLIDRAAPYGEKTAILFSGLTFGLFHMNLFQFFYAFALGLLFAYVYTRTRRLRYSVALHMIINFIGSVLAPMVLNGMDSDLLNQMASGQAETEAVLAALPGLLGVVCYAFTLLGLSIWGLVMLILKVPKFAYLPASQELLKGQRARAMFGNVGVILFTLVCLVMFVANLVLV